MEGVPLGSFGDGVDKYILSICIPTFNHAEDLDETLRGIIEQDGFGDDIEVVVVDNASTDDTSNVVYRYSEKRENIRYVRNDRNIGPDRNILRAALLGNGKYIKLLNDNKILKNGVITDWLDLYSSSSEAVIFHYPNAMNLPEPFSGVYSVDTFLSKVSYYITWLGGISFKREALQNLSLVDIRYDSFLIQTDILLKLLCKYKEGRIVFSDWWSEKSIRKRSGYNYFEVFTNNFIDLLNEVEGEGYLSHSTKQNIKRELLRDHTFPFIIGSFLLPQRYAQKKDGGFYYLFKNFHTCFELYLFPFWVIRHAVPRLLRHLGHKA